MLDARKICFIRCINDDMYASEQDYYLSKLAVPEGFDIDVLSITDALSMCSGYNEGMAASDAKYKIYLHQDVFIFQEDFLIRLIDTFERHPSLGMLGLVGNPTLSPSLEPWQSPRAGLVLTGVADKILDFGESLPFAGDYEEVQVIDGFLMATQVDLPWREDLFKGWDMYDLSQSMEMKRAGHKVGVIRQEGSWVLHDESVMHLSAYYDWLEVFRAEYERDIIDSDPPPLSFKAPSAVCIVPCGGNNDFAGSLSEAGYAAHTEERQLHPSEEDPLRDAFYLKHRYSEGSAEAVVSQLFIPSAALFCKERGIPYISWIYDSPQQALYQPEALYETNHFFIFDKALCRRMEELSLPNVSHRPLCANITRSEQVIRGITPEDRRRFSHDISFVGNLYSEDSYLAAFDDIGGDCGRIIREYYQKNLCRWEAVRPWPKMPGDICDEADKTNTHGSMPSDVFYGTAIMSRKLAQLERHQVLNTLAQKYRVDLYTNSDTSHLASVACHPSVNYYTDAVKVFHLSKINLNITLPSIETGVPQRVLDIMAAGGFVLTNHQEEMGELFDIDREIVTFRNIDELLEKTEYYLAHESKRRAIAESGQRRVKTDYDMKKAMGEIYGSVMSV